MSQSPIPIQ